MPLPEGADIQWSFQAGFAVGGRYSQREAEMISTPFLGILGLEGTSSLFSGSMSQMSIGFGKQEACEFYLRVPSSFPTPL